MNIKLLLILSAVVVSCDDEGRKNEINKPTDTSAKEAFSKPDTVAVEEIDTVFTWYKSGKLKSKVAEKKGLKNGDFFQYYENGTLQFKRLYDNDTLAGISYSFYPNGAKETEINFRKGKKNGTYFAFSPNGNVKLRMILKDDEIISSSKYYENGTLDFTDTMVDGKHKMIR